jgi:LCP family protein required for cell wall assembly
MSGRRSENWGHDQRQDPYARTAQLRTDPYADPFDDPYGRAGSPGHPEGPASRRPRRRRWGRILLVLTVVLVMVAIGGYFYLDSRLNREAALPDYAGRPADTPGTNWLIVGSDSREGLSRQDRSRLRTGNAAGRRTDSMMLLHTGAGGTTLVSLPRDSYVAIPGKGRNKLNAAFAFGGPQLLARTVEQATGIRIDHYAEIGLGGFVGVVDAVGGVRMCVKQPMKDPKAGLDLKAGCQVLTGGQALGYVRTRASARADLDRVTRQREFFSALIDRATDPGVLANPFRSIPLALNATDNFAVDDGDHVHNLFSLLWSMRGLGGGKGVTTTVPVGGFGSAPGVGSYLEWDRAKATALFNALKADTKVPSNVVTK